VVKSDKNEEIEGILEGLLEISDAYFVAIETGMNIDGNPITLEELEILSKNLGEELDWVKLYTQTRD